MGMTDGVNILRLRTDPSHPEIVSSEQFRRIAYLEASKTLREPLGHSMPSER